MGLDEDVDLLLHVLDLGRDGESDDGTLGGRPDSLPVEAVQRVQAALFIPAKLKRLCFKFRRRIVILLKTSVEPLIIEP